MAIGTDETFSFFIVRHADDVGGPGSASDFRDYSGEFLKWSYKANISQVGFFDGVLVQRESASDLAAQKLDFAPNNLLYVLSGLTLICKVVIDRAEFKDDYTITVKGYQSTGCEIDLRKLLSETTNKGSYKDALVSDIYDDLFDDVLPLGIMGPDPNVSFKYDFQNKIQALTKLTVQGHMEWVIDYGANDATPFSGGDEIEINDRVGSGSSVYTFNLTGSNINATFSTGDDDKDSLINDVIVKGTVQGGIQSQAHMFDSTGIVTYISNGSWDSWLYEAMDGGIDVINVNSAVPGGGSFRAGEKIRGDTSLREAVIVKEYTAGSVYSIDYTSAPDATTTKDPLLFVVGETLRGLTSGITNSFTGWRPSNIGPLIVKIKKGSQMQFASDGYIKIDAERMDFNAVVTSNPDYDLLRIRGANRSGGTQFGRGQEFMATKATPHAVGADVVYLGRSNTGTPSPYYMSVDDASAFPASGNILIGSEFCSYTSKVGDNLFVEREFQDSYAHSNGMRVQRRFLPTSPDTSTTNSIRTNGIKSATVSENSGGTKDALDRKAMSIIENKNDIKRIQINASDYFDAFDTIVLGDRVTLNGAAAINMTDGSGYRVMGFEFSFDYGEVNLIYYLNTNDTRTWASTEFTYADASEEADQDRKQEAARTSDNERAIESTGEGVDNTWTTTPGLIQNVADPSDSYDAVNKKYVDQVAGASGGTSADVYVKVRATDTTTNYLFSKVTAGAGITLTVINPGGNEQIQISSAASTNYWARNSGGSPYIYPATAGDDVCPNTSNSYLGQQGIEWSRVYGQSFRTHNSAMYLETIYSGTSTHYIRNSETGQITKLNVEGNIIPTSNLTYDLGESGAYWNNVRGAVFLVEDRVEFQETGLPTISGSGTFGVRLYHEGNALANFRDINIQFNRMLDIDTPSTLSLHCHEDAWFDGLVQLGTGSSDMIEINGRIDTDIRPSGDVLYDLGSSSLMWDGIWTDGLYVESDLYTGPAIVIFDAGGYFYCDCDVSFAGEIWADSLGTGSGTDLIITASNYIRKKSSSIIYKKDITDMRPEISKPVFELTPREFKWRSDNRADFGLIAEEVYKIIPMLVNLNKEGKPESVRYDLLSVLLLQELKEIKKNQELILAKMGGNNGI